MEMKIDYRRLEMIRETKALLEILERPRPEPLDFPNRHLDHVIEAAPRQTLFGLIAEGPVGYLRRSGFRPGLPGEIVMMQHDIPIYPPGEYSQDFVADQTYHLRQIPGFQGLPDRPGHRLDRCFNRLEQERLNPGTAMRLDPRGRNLRRGDPEFQIRR